ncbi:hypothetical protein ACIBD9_29490 [Micromonospora sp. NPDC050784]|uniref:hypothetical protein n=1 Tax=Micromonospora sp. NPDC050784 TaxID=3364281 RepID=UPI0037B47E56
MIRLNRHPLDARMARNGVVLGLFFFLTIGAVCSVLVYLVVTDEPGSGLASDPTFTAGAVGALSCLLMVIATATALLNRRWATPALVVLAFCGWVVGVIVVVVVSGGEVDPETFGLVILLLAARPRLMLRNYLASLATVDAQPATPPAR